MLQQRENICRLCLSIIHDANFTSLEEDERDMLEITIPNMLFFVSKDPVLCKKCLNNLHHSYIFKSKCLEVEEAIQESRNGARNGDCSQKLNLEDIIDVKIKAEVGSNKLCRTCLGSTHEKVVTPLIDGAETVKMLDKCMPELEVKICNDPVMCEKCLSQLEQQFTFVEQCIYIQNKINEFCESTKCFENINLWNVHDVITLKPEIAESQSDHLTGITIETNALETEENSKQNIDLSGIIKVENEKKIPHNDNYENIVNNDEMLGGLEEHTGEHSGENEALEEQIGDYSGENKAEPLKTSDNVKRIVKTEPQLTSNNDDHDKSLTVPKKTIKAQNNKRNKVPMTSKRKMKNKSSLQSTEENETLPSGEDVLSKKSKKVGARQTNTRKNLKKKKHPNENDNEDEVNPVKTKKTSKINPVLEDIDDDSDLDNDELLSLLNEAISDNKIKQVIRQNIVSKELNEHEARPMTTRKTSKTTIKPEFYKDLDKNEEPISNDTQKALKVDPDLQDMDNSDLDNDEFLSLLKEAINEDKIKQVKSPRAEEMDTLVVDIKPGVSLKIENRELIIKSEEEEEPSRKRKRHKQENDDLKYPVIIKNGRKTYKCKECGYLTVARNVYRNHFNAKHALENDLITYPCNYCNFVSLYKISLKNHIAKKHESVTAKTYNCSICKYKTVHKGVLKRHVTRHTSKVQLKCELCSYETKFKPYLASHLRMMHAPENTLTSYHCDKCGYSSTIKCNLRRHIRAVHRADEIKMLDCIECDYKSKTSSDMRMHIQRMHTSEDEITIYKCDQCGFKTKHKGNYKRHLIKHKPPEEVVFYKCSQCKYKCTSNCMLNKHFNIMHRPEEEVTVFRCNICDYSSRVKGNLEKHVIKYRH